MITIVGAGPSGLTASLLLSQNKIPHRVLERRKVESGHPRATVLNTRSMEIMRQLGLTAPLRQQALSGDLMLSMRWFQNLASAEVARFDLVSKAAALIERGNFSPAMSCICPQDIIEPILLEHAKKSQYAQIHLGAEVISTRQDEHGVYNTVRYDNGKTEDISSSYLLAADGANSPIRHELGIEMLGETSQQWVVNVHFRADLGASIKKKPAFLYWIVNTQASGFFITLNGTNRWLFNHLLPLGEREYSIEYLHQLLKTASGNPKLEPEIVHHGAWLARAEVAERYRSGRVFLVGDAAHRFPPTGGLGMNSGIQDAHNLAWKLAMVLQNKAEPTLLETYEAERRPVALSNAALSWANFGNLSEGGIGNTQLAAQLEQHGKAHNLAKATIQANMPSQGAHFDHAGQELGFVYQSSATIGDGLPLPESSIAQYIPSATPGARMPHTWVKYNQELHSSLDLVQGWTLVAAQEAGQWAQAGRMVAERLGLALHTVQEGHQFFETTPQEQIRARSAVLNESVKTPTRAKIILSAIVQKGSLEPLKPRDKPLTQLCGIGETGAILVRPDGHVAWRSADAQPNPEQILSDVFTQLLGRTNHSKEAMYEQTIPSAKRAIPTPHP